VPSDSDTYEIRGQVLSAEDDSPLPGVTVQIKGSLTGVNTDESGGFILTARNSRLTISFSYLGYRTLDTALILPLLNPLVIKLRPDAAMLDETVVIGYGTTTRRLNTGNVGRVIAEEISRQPVGDPMLALQGRIPGLVVTQTRGLPGSEVAVMIRGRNSIASGNEPLYIVDGVPFISSSLSQISGTNGKQSPFHSLNPADIASIEVLKDADATAIYGSRGANGVILITTKKGKEGKVRLDVNANIGIGQVGRMMELMDTRQYLEMRREAFANDGVTPTPSNAPDLMAWDTTRYTNWQELLIGNTAQIHDIQVAVSGGSETTTFRLGGGFRHETTVFPGDLADRRGSVQLSLNHTAPDDRFSMGVTANYSNDRNNLIPSDMTGSIFSPPNAPLYDESGEIAWSENGASFSNPLAGIYTFFSAVTDNLIGNANARYRILPGLTAKLNAGYTQTQFDETSVTSVKSYNPVYNISSGRSRFGLKQARSWIAEPQLRYELTTRESRGEILLGTSWQQEIRENSIIDASNYSNEALLFSPEGAATIQNSSAFSEYRYQSIFGRVHYDYKKKYLINLTGRRDGSSRFGPGRQYANFGALGIGWIFSEENLIQERLPFISFGKLRGSYGLTGNDKIGEYRYLETYGNTRYPYEGISGLVPLRLFNPDYGWETNRKLEAALELGFVNNRVLLSTAWFRNRSGNQLLNYTLPVQTGFSGITRNLPALVENTGWEFQLQYFPNLGTEFGWEIDMNLTVSRNELLDFPNLENSSYGSRYKEGYSLDIVQVYPFKGVNPETGVYQFDTEAGRSVILDMTPNYYGGLSNTLQYRNLQLNLFFQIVNQQGRDYKAGFSSAPGRRNNIPVALENRWQNPGDDTEIQKFSNTGSPAFAHVTWVSSAGAYVDASYIRLKNISLTYSLPKQWFGNITWGECRVSLQCQNLLTITSYQGADPEVMSPRILPPLKMITGRLQLTF